ncbi:TonB-dependent receptor [candidate division KSB1 bacterium]|nr:TonB-dependent receptor [candidate division KSB1 bacterium]
MKRMFLTIWALLCVYGIAMSGTTGKIVGRILDIASKEPLIGVNVVIENTNIGAATDAEGYYLILNVPPGIYSLRARYMGYSMVQVKNVRVTVDQTTTVNINLVETALEADETVTVVAERPLIRTDETSKSAVIDGSAITDRLPVATINDVLAMQSGVVTDASGAIHIRGGRLGEIAYLVDGTYVRDPFDNSLGVNVDIEAIQEMELISGTFNAEYGNAMSGIVNVVTKEGSPKYQFKFQYESSQLNQSPYHKADWLLDTDLVKGLSREQQLIYLDAVRTSSGASGYEHVSVLDSKYAPDKTLLPVLGRFNSSASGPIPFVKNASFFIAGTFRNEDSWLPFGFSLDRNVSSKLTFKPATNLKLQLSADWSNRWYQLYDHQYKYWRFMEANNMGSYPIWFDEKMRLSLYGTHTLSAKTFYNLSISRIFNNSSREIEERTVTYNENTGALIYSDYLDRGYWQGAEGNFRTGDDRYWNRTHTTTYDLDFDLTSQVNRFHLVKTGLEFRIHDIFRHRIGMPPRANREFFDKKPYELAVYAQDKIELDYLVVNLGLRFDYFDPQSYYFSDPGHILQTITDETGQSTLSTVPSETAPSRFQISPRIGLAHPITESTVFHFAYGHFFQIPRYYDLYLNNDLEDILANDALVGNPGLLPEKTVAFEVGFKQKLAEDFALDVNAYYKDISNLISSFYYFSGRDYTIYINADYGRIQGVDLTLSKRYSNHFSGALNYTFMIAKGNESDPSEGYSLYREEDAHLRPNRNFYLDFDRRHSLNMNVGFDFPKQFGPSLGGIYPLAQVAANFIFYAASGLPYTPTSRDPDASVLPEKNSARKSWVKRVDVRLSKKVNIARTDFDFYVRIENLFDNINVLRVWTATGDPWNQGPTSNYSKDRQANPENVDIRRDLRAGLIVRF